MIVTTKRACQIADAKTTKSYRDGHPFVVAGADLGGYRTVLGVPMLKDNELTGAIAIYRQEVQPFSEKQIEVLENFAAQAVIAIENTRLLNELRQRTDDLTESLEQQTATSEVLKVISSSPGALQPVFDAMLANATRICEAKFGSLFRFDGKTFEWMAGHGTPAPMVEFQSKRGPFLPAAGTFFDRMVQAKRVTSVTDATTEELVPGIAARFGGARSAVAVPMLQDEALVGAFTIYRQEVRPFTDKQIQLLQNFAAQAVIAIENTRLLNELQQRTDDLSEALEQQTATSEVLQVISNSPGTLQPVFETMLANAVRICEAKLGTLSLCEDHGFRHVAGHGLPPAYVEFRQRQPVIHPGANAPLRRVAETKRAVSVWVLRFLVRGLER